MNRSSPSKLFSLAYPAIVLFVVLTGPVAGLMLDPSPAVPFSSAQVSAATQPATAPPQAIPCAF
jgi:hypothetical protein